MSLLDLALFEPLFAPFRGKKVGFVTLSGNVGDRLIDAAAEQLLADFHISHRVLKPQELERGELYFPLDAILVSGGGNMGGLYPRTQQQRRQALALGAPVTVLPQSFTDAQEDLAPFARVFVRERASLGFAPAATLAPDLALGLRPPWEDEGAEARTGVWLRNDRERKVPDSSLSLGDPIEISWRIEEYLGLASKFEHIVTDRLHFAIAGLLVGRRVTLLPNSYHKNRSMYETWLRDLGCRWRNSADGIKVDWDGMVGRLWRRFAAPPSALVPWDAHPRRNAAHELVRRDDGIELRQADGTILRLNPAAGFVWTLSDGSWTVEDLCQALAEQFRQPLLSVARDVQGTLRDFQQRGIVEHPASEAPATDEIRPAPRSRRRRCIELDVQAPRKQGGRLRWSAQVRGTRHGDLLHWFELDPRLRGMLTPRADPFVLALLPRAMRDGLDLRVAGAPVDAALLEHLDEYQRAWQAWRPEHLHAVEIAADAVAAFRSPARPAVAAFSGGLDSAYTMFRHCVAPDGRRNLRLEAVVMGLGLDIPIHDGAGYRAAVERLRPVVDEAGAELIEVATNLRTYLRDWEMEHGAALAALLSLFAGRFGAGLIPATAPYRLLFPWGSNPITDPMLGGAFEIRHDSAGVLRFDKLRAIRGWPSMRSRLRVCWENRDPAHNCGRCAKCCQLAMGLQALQAPLDCFDRPPAPDVLAAYASKAILSNLERLDIACVLTEAQRSRLDEPWVRVLAERMAPVPDGKHTDGQATMTTTPKTAE